MRRSPESIHSGSRKITRGRTRFAGIDRIFTSGINHVLRGEIGVDSERRYS